MGEIEKQEAVIKIEPPLTEDLTEELLDFWEAIFEVPCDGYRSILNGSERDDNHDIFYLLRKGKELGGTSHLTISKADPRLGGLGEVATPSEFRRQGIATALCAHTLEDFRTHNGQAFFLGTVNPEAARVYHRLGWRKLAGANVMAFIANGDSPEAFLVDYFREGGPAEIAPSTPADRIPMIPLLLCPHDWKVLDANVSMFSTRYVVQNSCMGLYPRYEALAQDGRGAWFALHANQGRVVGLSSARLDESGHCQVDGFTHQSHADSWEDLMAAALRWGADRGGGLCCAIVSVEDEDKRVRFESLGLQESGAGGAFNLGDRQVPSIRLERQ